MALTRLKLVAFADNGFSGDGFDPFEVLMNPETYRRSCSVEYADEQSPGTVAPELKFKGMPADSIGFKLIFDGTNSIANLPESLRGKDVTAQIQAFEKTTLKYNGEIHRPNFVRLSWGTFTFKGVLTELNLEYTLFKDDGTPLRASADVTFKATMSTEEAALEAGRKSPDLTRVRQLVAGETLPGLCCSVYGEVNTFVQVARVNRMDRLRDIDVGTFLRFPPLRKS
jgi:hypothetical protein